MDSVVISDLHLSEAEPFDPRRPYWKAYKRREFFVDDDVIRLLEYVENATSGPLELVLNGDTFDFDNVTSLPQSPERPIDWLARLRGLASEEWMSLYKIERIIADHPRWFDALTGFIARGHRVVVIIGNHDLELHWPSVQRRIRRRLGLDGEPEGDDLAGLGEDTARGEAEDQLSRCATPAREPRSGDTETSGGGAEDAVTDPIAEPLVFCDWFYLSEGDAFITHGHMYDTNCSVPSAIDPWMRIDDRLQVRIPFGDLAERYMLNGMGYFNPHATQSFIMSGVQYLAFFVRHLLRTQPLLIWTWLWGAVVTFSLALSSSWRPSIRDPLTVEDDVSRVAKRARGTASMVRRLHATSVPWACANPLRIMRELWLDRGALLVLVFFVAWHVVLTVNFLSPISPAWVLLPLGILLPIYFIYAFSVHPTVFAVPLLTGERARMIAAVTGVSTIIFGHTHEPKRRREEPVDYINGGFWSQAFADPGCTERIGTQSFVWLRHTDAPAAPRRADLLEWPPGGSSPRPFDPPPSP